VVVVYSTLCGLGSSRALSCRVSGSMSCPVVLGGMALRSSVARLSPSPRVTTSALCRDSLLSSGLQNQVRVSSRFRWLSFFPSLRRFPLASLVASCLLSIWFPWWVVRNLLASLKGNCALGPFLVYFGD
jgi:hypothetical protein